MSAAASRGTCGAGSPRETHGGRPARPGRVQAGPGAVCGGRPSRGRRILLSGPVRGSVPAQPRSGPCCCLRCLPVFTYCSDRGNGSGCFRGPGGRRGCPSPRVRRAPGHQPPWRLRPVHPAQDRSCHQRLLQGGEANPLGGPRRGDVRSDSSRPPRIRIDPDPRTIKFPRVNQPRRFFVFIRQNGGLPWRSKAAPDHDNVSLSQSLFDDTTCFVDTTWQVTRRSEGLLPRVLSAIEPPPGLVPIRNAQ
jgi:hypothetical protein